MVQEFHFLKLKHHVRKFCSFIFQNILDTVQDALYCWGRSKNKLRLDAVFMEFLE